MAAVLTRERCRGNRILDTLTAALQDGHVSCCSTTASTCVDALRPAGRRAAARLPRPAGPGHQPRAARRRRRGRLARALAGACPTRGRAADRRAARRYEAVRLFVERAPRRAARLRARPTQNAAAVAEICRRLDGIPLAIELAAARVRVLSPEQIAARLDDRFRLLTGGSRTALPRQQTLRAHRRLEPRPARRARERALLRRLAVFAGGFTLDGGRGRRARATASGATRCSTCWRSWSTGRWSLVEELPASARYRLLETIRQYALERLTGRASRRDARSPPRALPGLAERAAAGDEGAGLLAWLPTPRRRARRPAGGVRLGACRRRGWSSACGSSAPWPFGGSGATSPRGVAAPSSP